MGQVFGPSANTIARVSLVLMLLLVAGGLGALDLIHRSPYVRYTYVPQKQPVPFSHKHHINMGIDCRYCHTSVEDSNFANVPPTRTCMNCHNIIFKDAPTLKAVQDSWASGESLEWTRVYDLPDFVYFNHSIHVNKGIGCTTCHGKIDEMPLTWKEEPLFMKWCLDCHREPEKFIRPREEVFNVDWVPPADQLAQGRELVKEYKVDSDHYRLTECWICHR